MTHAKGRPYENSNSSNLKTEGFNKEEIERIRNLLNSIEKKMDRVHLHNQASFLIFMPVVLKTHSIMIYWVIDSRAIYQMTYCSQSFITYNPYTCNKKIKFVDDFFTTNANQGIVTLFSSLPLKNMLLVLNLSINILFVHQVTKDLDRRVTFYPIYCVFQDWVMGSTIGHGKEKNGLYFL